MKLTKTATKIKPGMTLIEITVVILVLLTLISVLFIGANIYKRGADRAACILNIRNVHQSVRANQNLNNKKATDLVSLTDEIYSTVADASATPVVVGVERYMVAPNCPTDDADYTQVGTAYPATGTPAVTCTNNGALGTGEITDHLPADTGGW